MAGARYEELVALYPPQQVIAMERVRRELLDNPNALDPIPVEDEQDD